MLIITYLNTNLVALCMSFKFDHNQEFLAIYLQDESDFDFVGLFSIYFQYVKNFH